MRFAHLTRGADPFSSGDVEPASTQITQIVNKLQTNDRQVKQPSKSQQRHNGLSQQSSAQSCANEKAKTH